MPRHTGKRAAEELRTCPRTPASHASHHVPTTHRASGVAGRRRGGQHERGAAEAGANDAEQFLAIDKRHTGLHRELLCIGGVPAPCDEDGPLRLHGVLDP